MLYLRTAQWWW